MNENPQGQPGSQYAHVPDKIAALEMRVAALEAHNTALTNALDQKFADIGAVFNALLDHLEGNR